MEKSIIPNQKGSEARSDVELAIERICPSGAIFIQDPQSTRRHLCQASYAL